MVQNGKFSAYANHAARASSVRRVGWYKTQSTPPPSARVVALTRARRVFVDDASSTPDPDGRTGIDCLVKRLNRLDLPTFGKPTMPMRRLFRTRPKRAAPTSSLAASAFFGGMAVRKSGGGVCGV